ncbi:MAG: methyltransferase domain-containing protein [Vicinamibacterales bacterium]
MVRGIRSGQLRRLQPMAGGRQRGTPVVRYYWEEFLEAHRQDIRGRGLEIGATSTLSRFGMATITRAEALDLAPRPGVDVVADLSRADQLPGGTYDCFVVPFTMHFIYDVESALYHAVRILKPGGTLLVNFPCVDYYFPAGLDMGTGKPLFVFWWFTPLHVENLLRRIGLAAEDFELVIDGNLFSRVAYQMNLPVEELTALERDYKDQGHPLLINARIVQPAGWKGVRPEPREPWLPATTPAAWNPVTGHYPLP